jgi:hypothetical protein
MDSIQSGSVEQRSFAQTRGIHSEQTIEQQWDEDKRDVTNDAQRKT